MPDVLLDTAEERGLLDLKEVRTMFAGR